MCFQQFVECDKDGYQSDGESNIHYVWYKMAEKRAHESILGKFGKNPLSVGGGARRRVRSRFRNFPRPRCVERSWNVPWVRPLPL